MEVGQISAEQHAVVWTGPSPALSIKEIISHPMRQPFIPFTHDSSFRRTNPSQSAVPRLFRGALTTEGRIFLLLSFIVRRLPCHLPSLSPPLLARNRFSKSVLLPTSQP